MTNTKAFYGLCVRCNSPICIPGIDADLCPSCGWIAQKDWVESVIRREEIKRRKQHETRQKKKLEKDRGRVA